MIKKIIKIATTVLAALILILVIIFNNNPYKSKEAGEIVIALVDIDENIISNRNIKYSKYNTFEDILKENYTVKIDNGFLMEIDSLVTPQDFSSFICLYHNDKMAETGVNKIKFKNGDNFSFVMTRVI